MRYLGGKFRVAKPIVNFLNSIRKYDQWYCEPFIGGGSVIRLMNGLRIGNDYCPYLITFYKQLQSGWLPPQIMSETRYKELQYLYKQGVCNGEIGFAMYFCSFGGKAWGGYARNKKGETNSRVSSGQYNDAVKLQKQIQQINFHNMDYEVLLNAIPIYSLVYCDPPYKDTTEYKNKFDHTRFWKAIRKFSETHDIYISEYQAPEDFKCVWSLERKTNLHDKNGDNSNRIERIFKYEKTS